MILVYQTIAYYLLLSRILRLNIFLPPYKPASPTSKNTSSPMGAPAPGGLLPADPWPILGGGGGGCARPKVLIPMINERAIIALNN